MEGKSRLLQAALFAFVLLAFLLTGGQAQAVQNQEITAPSRWHIDQVSRTNSVGDCSMTLLDAFGRPHVLYYDATNKALFYRTISRTGWTGAMEVDPARRGHILCYGGLALTATNRPVVVFSTDDNHLYYVPTVCTTRCAFQAQEVVTNLTGSILYPVVALWPGDSPRILFVNDTHLVYAQPNGSGWVFEQPLKVDGTNVLVGGPPLNILRDANGNLHAAYYCMKHHPWHLERTGAGWNLPERLDPGEDYNGIALALDSNNLPHVAAVMEAPTRVVLYSYACPGGVCAWSQQVLDQLPDAVATSEISGVRLAMDKQNNPNLTYYYRDDSGKAGLKYLKYDGKAWQQMMIDGRTEVGRRCSLGLMPNGDVRVSYFEGGKGGLNFAWQLDPMIYLPLTRR